MKLGPAILKILNKNHPPNDMVKARYKNIDLTFKTDGEGRPLLLFMGKSDGGNIQGERFVRTLVADPSGKIIKDHWEHKGKAT